MEPSATPEGSPARKKASRRSDRPSDEGRATRILVVEDEEDLQELLRGSLEREGYTVVAAYRGDHALKAFQSTPPDIVLLDLMLPGVDGLEVCRELKRDAATRDIPVVMLTAKGEEADIVAGLELGADDYVTKPFSTRVLLARLKAVARRRTSGGEGAKPGERVRIGDLLVDPDRHEARVADEPVSLTATEFRLLHLLASHPGRVFTRQQIIRGVHDASTVVTDRSVDVQVLSLRRKLGDSGRRIHTIRGVGYRLDDG